MSQIENHQQAGHADQRYTGQLLGTLAKLFADARSDPRAGLGGEKCLDAYPNNGDSEGESKESEAEANASSSALIARPRSMIASP